MTKLTETLSGQMQSPRRWKNVKVAFDIQEDGEEIPKGYQFVRCHMIFTVKMEDFRRKARFVAGGAHDQSARRNDVCERSKLYALPLP